MNSDNGSCASCAHSSIGIGEYTEEEYFMCHNPKIVGIDYISVSVKPTDCFFLRRYEPVCEGHVYAVKVKPESFVAKILGL